VATYILARLALVIPVVLVVSLIVFSLIRIAPGDVVELMMEGMATGGSLGSAEQTAKRLRAELGLDKPIYVQYLVYVGGLVRGDFGKSAWTGRPTIGEIGKALPVTVQLTAMSMVIAIVVAIPLGTLSAVRQDTWIDYSARIAAIVGLSLPSFWTGTIIVVFLALLAGYAVPLGYASLMEDPWSNFQKLIFPAFVLGMGLAGSLARMVRSSLLEVLRQEYVRTAFGKGLTEWVVVVRHAMKNALIPIITIMGLQLGSLLGGTVIVETIFSVPGIGSLTVSAIQRRDFTQLQTNVLVFSTFLLLMNFGTDLLYSWLDPRIRYGKPEA
jgi:peptide/nickel transport system permease protein